MQLIRYGVLVLLVALVWPVAAQMPHTSIIDTLTTDSTWTDSLDAKHWQGEGHLNISIFTDSSWNATVSLQRRFDTTSAWMTVKEYTPTDTVSGGSIQEYVKDKEPRVFYRLGIATGNYTSGSVIVRLSR